jgi:uncharacterized lipoprotein YajG
MRRHTQALMKLLPLAATMFLLTGCAEPVTVQNPRTGETLTCKTAAAEWNPWSQAEACVADHLAQGWTITR